MSQSVTRARNNCGEWIEVGHTYRVNNASPQEACQKKEPGIEVRVTGLEVLSNGWILARIDYPRDSHHNIYLSHVIIDRLYSPLLVSSTFRPSSYYTDQICRA